NCRVLVLVSLAFALFLLVCYSLFFILLHPLFFFQVFCDHLALHSFPTRRSSDLPVHRLSFNDIEPVGLPSGSSFVDFAFYRTGRSEEHTSELQSRFDLVCRLLLEKKKKKLRTYNKIDQRKARQNIILPTR